MRKVVAAFIVSFAFLAEAAPADIQLIGPAVSDWVHVGDSSVSSWPASVGPEWATSFNLEVAPLVDATLQFYHIEADPDNNPVTVNGVELAHLTESDGTITRDPFDDSQWVEQTIVIPTGILQAGDNSIRVTAGESFGGSLPLDDFMLKDMRLNVVPEPTTVGLLALSSVVMVLARRR